MSAESGRDGRTQTLVDRVVFGGGILVYKDRLRSVGYLQRHFCLFQLPALPDLNCTPKLLVRHHRARMSRLDPDGDRPGPECLAQVCAPEC